MFYASSQRHRWIREWERHACKHTYVEEVAADSLEDWLRIQTWLQTCAGGLRRCLLKVVMAVHWRTMNVVPSRSYLLHVHLRCMSYASTQLCYAVLYGCGYTRARERESVLRSSQPARTLVQHGHDCISWIWVIADGMMLQGCRRRYSAFVQLLRPLP